MIACSDYDEKEIESRVLTAVEDNGRVLKWTEPLLYPRFGEFVSTRGVDIDVRAEVMVNCFVFVFFCFYFIFF